MEVRLYFDFHKRLNSTKVPGEDNAYNTYNVTLKDSTSIMNPVIIFSRSTFYQDPGFYYAYIPDFNRYYYIEDWTYSAGTWIATMREDVLASWVWLFQHQELYCLRTSNPANMDKSIIDGKVVCTSEKDIQTSAIATPFHVESMNNGTYVLGITGQNGPSGGVTYYALSAIAMVSVCNVLFDNDASIFNWDASELSYALTKSLVNPLQYIVSAHWFPFTIESGTVVTTIDFGWWPFSVSSSLGIRKLLTSSMETFELTDMTPLQHPATSTIGKWLNTSPYSRMTLMFEPFGMIALDPMDFVVSNSLTMSITVDYVTGEGALFIGNDPDKSAITEPIKEVRAQIGVPIMLTQQVVDYIGTAIAATSVGVQAKIGNVLGAVQGVISAAESALPQVETNGTQGSCAIYANVFPTLVQEFLPVKDIDVDHMGRPCCKTLQMSLIGKGSFYQFNDGDIDIPCSAGEAQELKTFLEGGILYE